MPQNVKSTMATINKPNKSEEQEKKKKRKHSNDSDTDSGISLGQSETLDQLTTPPGTDIHFITDEFCSSPEPTQIKIPVVEPQSAEKQNMTPKLKQMKVKNFFQVSPSPNKAKQEKKKVEASDLPKEESNLKEEDNSEQENKVSKRK